MLEKNSYRKTSRISLVFVPLNGILIKITHRKTEQDQSHTSLQVNILPLFIYILPGKKISDLFNMVSAYFMIEQEIL